MGAILDLGVRPVVGREAVDRVHLEVELCRRLPLEMDSREGLGADVLRSSRRYGRLMSESRGRPPLPERAVARIRAVSTDGWRRLDVAVAVSIFVALTIPALLGVPSQDGSPVAVVSFGAASSLPLAVRRRWPLAVVVVVVAATALGTALGVRFTPFASNASPAVALAMYTLAERSERRLSVGALVVAFALSWVATEIAVDAHPHQDHNAVHAVAALVGWVGGDAVRTRGAYRADLAARQRSEAEERARRAIAEERLRISREVHDVVSNGLSVIAVQAGVGRLLFDEQPEQARAALGEVEMRSRAALEELRRVLSSVRQPGPGLDSLEPAPGLGDLPGLVDRMAASGLELTLAVDLQRATLPPMLELSAYRIVQEALTNVLKHAADAPAHVTVRHRSGALTIEVVDSGPTPPTSRAGRPGWGIAGMQERGALFGGTLVAAPVPGGGFRVAAWLPTDGRTGSDGERR